MTGEIIGADADAIVHVVVHDGQHLAVANPLLAVVYRIKVVGQDDRLVVGRSVWVYGNSCEEDDAVLAVEVDSLQLFDDILIYHAVIIAQTSSFILALVWVVLVIRRGLGGDEIQLKVAAIRMGTAEGTGQPEGAGKERNDDSAGRKRQPTA